MIDPDVRSATSLDAEQLEWLESESRSALVGQRGGDRWLETHPPRRDRWLESVDRDVAWVAHIGEVLVGYLALVVSDGLATVDDVYVTPQARELGFGDALLAAAIDHAKTVGCSLLEGSSLPGDRDTKNLYERAGIKARLITVSTPI